MARIRSIHPDSCKSEKLHAASAEAERVYWRLLPHCDDEGRCEDDPRVLRSFMFPLDDGDIRAAQVDAWLGELESLGLLVRYEADGRRFIQVARWADYQKPQKKVESKIPPLPEDYATTTGALPIGVGDGVGEGEVVASDKRPQSAYFDAFVQAWQIDSRELTKPERDRVGLAASRLRDINADPGEIPARRQMYALLFPDAAQTMMALANRWAECRPDPERLPQKPGRSTSTVARAIARAS